MRGILATCFSVTMGVFTGYDQVSTRVLSTPAVELSNAFTQVDAVGELADGRVVLLDSREKLLRVADFDLGKVNQLGRKGGGPDEYQTPLRLMPISGGRIAIYDASNERLLIVSAKGTIDSAISLTADWAGANPATGARRLQPEASDTLGGLYYQLSAVHLLPDGSRALSDSIAIERLDMISHRRVVVAFMRNPVAGSRLVPGSRGDIVQPRSELRAFEGSDQWIAAPDGRVAVVSADPYRITYFERSRRLDGPAIAYERVRVADEDRQQWLGDLHAPTEALIVPRGAKQGSRVMTRSPGAGRPVRWPTYFPPFLRDALLFAPDGQLWVRRATTVTARPIYDVLGRDGRLAERVILPMRCHIVGFGAHSIYVVRTDEDDLQYLRRYAF